MKNTKRHENTMAKKNRKLPEELIDGPLKRDLEGYTKVNVLSPEISLCERKALSSSSSRSRDFESVCAFAGGEIQKALGSKTLFNTPGCKRLNISLLSMNIRVVNKCSTWTQNVIYCLVGLSAGVGVVVLPGLMHRGRSVQGLNRYRHRLAPGLDGVGPNARTQLLAEERVSWSLYLVEIQ
ncbi:hypothetical protein YC2023_103763 [Brassica napus]